MSESPPPAAAVRHTRADETTPRDGDRRPTHRTPGTPTTPRPRKTQATPNPSTRLATAGFILAAIALLASQGFLACLLGLAALTLSTIGAITGETGRARKRELTVAVALVAAIGVIVAVTASG